ncbi:endonuclease domain-containing protein [Demequina sp.]|uniref:endonuclease domain-containing protein n=1 Tax=Demequina sp. TaxID=2050685 RepID=UPI003D0DE6C2
MLDRALHDGSVMRILPNVYCAASHSNTPTTLGQALNLWIPRGLVTGPLALALIAPKLPAPGRAHVIVPYGHHLESPSWVRLLQRPALRTATVAQSVRCVSGERALLDAWAHAPAGARVDLLYRALWERACTWKQLKRELDRTPRVSGRRELDELLGWFERGATSPLEVRAHRDVFTGPRFADLEWQADLAVPLRKPVADILHRKAKVVVELDSREFHGDREGYDRERDIDLAAAGYVTIRLTWDDIVTQPEWCRERVLAVIAARLAAL